MWEKSQYVDLPRVQPSLLSNPQDLYTQLCTWVLTREFLFKDIWFGSTPSLL